MNPLMNLYDEKIMHFQLIFNLIQRYKGKTKFFDLRPTENFESCHIRNSIHLRLEIGNIEELDLGKISHEHEVSRLRRYCLIIGFTDESEYFANVIQQKLINIKCKEIHMLPELDDFFERYNFICEGRCLASDLPNEIIPNFLYLGTQEHAHNREIVELLGITHVLNATRGASSPFSGLKYCCVHIDDNETEKISSYFYKAYEFIDSALIGSLNGKRNIVLVHCAKGVSRSPTFVIMYLMRATG